MRLQYLAVNALAASPDLYVILYFIQLTVDKHDAGNNTSFNELNSKI